MLLFDNHHVQYQFLPVTIKNLQLTDKEMHILDVVGGLEYLDGIQNPEDLKTYVMLDPSTKLRYCGICNNFSHKALGNVRDHIESKHFKDHFIYSCDKCSRQFPTKMALFKHKPRCKCSTY